MIVYTVYAQYLHLFLRNAVLRARAAPLRLSVFAARRILR